MEVGTLGEVRYKLIGSAPNRILVVEFSNMTTLYDQNAEFQNNSTWQVRLYETSGQIEFVYGTMFRNATLNGGMPVPPPVPGAGRNSEVAIGYHVANATGSLVSINAATGTASTTAPFTWQQFPESMAMANLNSPVDGSRRVYDITPPATVTPPTGLSFSGVTPISVTLSWTGSPDGTSYGIYKSTDGTNFTYAGATTHGTDTFTANSLLPSQNYFWRVVNVNEGRVSAPLSGTQATQTPGNKSCNGAGGAWSAAGTWSPSGVPTGTDDVFIGSGCTITVDVTTAVALDVTVQSGGTLTYSTTTASTLVTTLQVTINSGGTIAGPASGTVTTHILNVGGNLTNNGTLDLSTNADTAGVELDFGGTLSSSTFSGTGAITDLRTMKVIKGTQANVLEMMPSVLTVRGVNTDSAGFAQVTSGTLKISGTFSMTNRTLVGGTFTTPTANYTIPAAAGFWLNNANYTVAGQTSTAASVTGLFRVTQGTYNTVPCR